LGGGDQENHGSRPAQAKKKTSFQDYVKEQARFIHTIILAGQEVKVKGSWSEADQAKNMKSYLRKKLKD
jgi:hypothetical protein